MHVLIVNPASSGARWISAARALGLYVTVLTPGTGHYALPENVLSDADHVETTTDVATSTILAAARRVHDARRIDLAVPGDEFSVPATARIAEEFGLPGMRPDDADAARDKGLMRDRLRAAGVRSPRHVIASDAAAAVAAADGIGYPCVVKPVGMVGTIGVRRTDNRADVAEAYRLIAADRLPMNGVLPGGTVIVESYLVGPEFSAEGVAVGGRTEVVAITEKFLGPEPNFQQVGHLVQPTDLVDGHAEVVAYIEAVVDALGITGAAFHAEYRVTPDGPVLIEIGARLAGDRIAEMVEMVTGACQAQTVLAAMAGLPAPAPRSVDAPVACIHFVTSPKLAGRSYRELRGWDDAARRREIASSVVSIGPGEPIPDTQDLRSRIAHLVFTAPNRATAVRLRESLVTAVDVLV
ncbi:MAG: ATP-grasp domain-containing protein [Streptomycetaceae bacterium]|nr:ATP-grasp domain-containing protein [Streptomycetaceae bacterium]